MTSRIGRRTGAAVLLTALALGLPCAAWYIAGSRAARDEARRLRQAPLDRAGQQAAVLAQRLAVRLESLRRTESRRPITEYEPGKLPADCACEPRLHSPLAQGPPDPLVWAHFQVNEVGQLTLPTLAGTESRGGDDARKIQQAIFERLECGATEPVAGAAGAGAEPTELLVADGDDAWVITVGAFAWQTVTLDDEDALVAVREVGTPRAVVKQGFVVRATDIEQLLSPALASVRPGEPGARPHAALPIEGLSWIVELDAATEIAAGADEARQVLRSFARVFGGGVLAALIGGCLIVGMVAQADRVARQRARFAASAAHELRTPLTGLRMYGEMLADGSGDPARGRVYARRVADEAERLGRVVTNLLSFSKLERGRLTVEATEGDLGTAVEATLAQLRPALVAGGARLQAQIAEGLPAVRFDRDALYQILQNLLDNAVKYGNAREHPVGVRVEHNGRGVRLSVTDRGPGVASLIQRRLFQPFVRGAAPGSDGLGLGLALVGALARAQGGSAGHDEVAGGGACFWVNFPVAA